MTDDWKFVLRKFRLTGMTPYSRDRGLTVKLT